MTYISQYSTKLRLLHIDRLLLHDHHIIHMIYFSLQSAIMSIGLALRRFAAGVAVGHQPDEAGMHRLAAAMPVYA